MLNLFYRNGRLLILTLCVIIFWGLTAFLGLPRLEDPELISRVSTVTTALPGASAERVEVLVTDPLEQAILEIEAVKTVESTSRLGISIIQVELQDSVSNVDPIWSRLRDEVSDQLPQLPPEAGTPEVETVQITANSLMVGLTWDLGTEPNYSILRRFAEALETDLRSIAGTDEVELFGDPTEEISVELDPSALADLRLTPQALAQQIAASDAKVSAGLLRSDRENLLFELSNPLDSLDRIRQIPVQLATNGQVVRLGDVAHVTRGTTQPLTEMALLQTRPTVIVAATVNSNSRVDEWATVARRHLAEFENQLPPGVTLNTILDQSRYIEARINTVISNLVIGALLVIGATLVIMGWQSALIVGTALPLSTLMVFGGLQVLSIPLHQISITGIIIALGLLIDNAIITVDEVETHLRHGLPPAIAVQATIQQLAIPLLASTLTTVLAFWPIATSPGATGEFTGTIGVTVILALGSSLVLSLTVIPALAARFLVKATLAETVTNGKATPTTPRPWWQTGLNLPWLSQRYQQSLTNIYQHPRWGIILGLILPLSGMLVFPTLPQQFFPPSGRDQFYLEFQLPNSASIAQTQAQVVQAEEVIRTRPAVEAITWFLGNGAPRFYYNVIAGQQNSPYYAQALVQLNSALGIAELIQQLQQELDQTFPEAQILVRQIEQGPPVPAPIEVRLYGPDLDELRQLGDQTRGLLAQLPDVIHTRANLTEALPKLGIAVDETQARLTGIDKIALAQQLEASLEGAVGGSILDDTEELPVRVRWTDTNRAALDQIASLEVLAGENGTVPLPAISTVQLNPDIATITRRDGERVNTVQAFVVAGTLPAPILGQFQQQLKDGALKLPLGYRFDFGGESDVRSSAIVNLLSRVGLLIISMAAVLILSFNSFILAAMIGAIAFCALGLGFFALFISSNPFGFTSILGSLGLVGLAINDSIVILAALQANPLARLGKPQAVQSTVLASTRHIIATTITTLVGFFPLLLDPTGFWPPLAICVAGGLGGTTLIALYTVPCVYLLIQNRRDPE